MTEYAERRKHLVGSFESAKIDALLVTSPANVRYLSGFTGSNGVVLVTPRRSTLLTDPRYQIQSRQESDCGVKVVRGPLIPALPKMEGHVGYEADHLTMSDFQTLKQAVVKQKARVRLRAVSGLVEGLRVVKSEAEIELIRRSVLLNSDAFAAAIGRFQPGTTERELAAEIDYQMQRLGAEKTAFETIVASGARTALPHAQPGRSAIGINELLLIDMGAQLNGYMSDMTRMVFPGKPGRKVRQLHQAVLDAQLEAIGAVREGATAGEVDGKARKVLKSHKLDTLFIHSTGHGLGLEIHEPPRVGRQQTAVLSAGMAITIEPGVYIQGFGGIRIEDTVLVTRTGCEVLTPTAKEMLVL